MDAPRVTLAAKRECNLCHKSDGHTETCPTLIRVDWTSSGSIWSSLAVLLFDMYVSAQYGAIVDRGTPHDERELDMFVRHCRQALDDGDPYTVLELIRIREG